MKIDEPISRNKHLHAIVRHVEQTAPLRADAKDLMRRRNTAAGKFLRAVTGGRCVFSLIACCLVLLASSPCEPVDKPTLVEYKAAFLYHFIDFVWWPAESLERPFTAGILGKSEIAGILSAVATKKTVDGKILNVETYPSVDAIGPYHLLFVTSAFTSELPRIRELIGQRNILTVSDTPGLAKRGIAINLTMVDDQLKFEINRLTLEGAGLRASAQLLKLAILVENGTPQ